MKMKEGASITDHVNEFNSILSRLMSIEIKFDDEVHALFLLSSLPENCSGTFTTVSGSTGKDKGRGIKQDKGQKQNRGRSKSKKRCQSKNSWRLCNALVCCVENTAEDRIMDYGASFHATYCKEELERFKLRSSKLDSEGIPGLKRSFMVTRGNKCGSLYMVEVPSDRINAPIDARGNATLWHQRLGHMSEKGMKILALKGRIPYGVGFYEPCVLGRQKKSEEYKASCKAPKNVLADSVNTSSYLINCGPSMPLGFQIQEEEWQGKEVSLAHLKIGYRFWDTKGHNVVRSTDVTFNEDSLYGANAATDSSTLMELNQKGQVSSDTSEGFENSKSFEDSGNSYEEGSKDGASFEEGGSKNPQMSRQPFLHGDLNEDISMEQQEGFSVSWERRKPRVQVEEKLVRIKATTEIMISLSSIVLPLYVDDMLVAGSDMEELKKLKSQLSLEFEMKDLGSAKQILGMSIIRDKTNGTLRLSQKKYIRKVLKKFNMKDAEARCSVMYAMMCTRPDIAHAVRVVSRFMSNPGKEHWEAVRWLLRYLKGTLKATLCFSRKEVVLEGLSDSDYEGCLDSGKSTMGYVFTVGDTVVSWMSKIHNCVAMSTTEAEYMAIAEAGKEFVWLKNFHEELDRAQIILGVENPANMLTKVVTTEKLKLCAASTGL
ncbi:retrovirus-related pol polyprotein from transposon TNT 1-94 [Tanacetum coccineum]